MSVSTSRLLQITTVAATALVAAIAVGCGSSGNEKRAGVEVVASTTQLADIARNVGGDAASVSQILSSKADPHDYEPRPGDVRDTAGADLVIVSGSRLDGWMSEVVEKSGGDPDVLQIAPEHTPYRLPSDERGSAGAGRYDPHWWHDPRNVMAAVAAIRDALIAADPGRAEDFRRAASSYVRRLRRLDAAIASCVDAIPPARRKLVTDHDALEYFAHRYGIEVIGSVIPSQTTQAQTSARDVARLVGVIERERLPAIFPSASANERLVRAIAKQTGATVGAALYADTLGAPGSPGATYLGMERHNADAIVRGLTGGRRGCA